MLCEGLMTVVTRCQSAAGDKVHALHVFGQLTNVISLCDIHMDQYILDPDQLKTWHTPLKKCAEIMDEVQATLVHNREFREWARYIVVGKWSSDEKIRGLEAEVKVLKEAEEVYESPSITLSKGRS